MKTEGQAMNPRHRDLKQIYDALAPESRRMFFESAAAIAEFSVYGVLDFIEQYNRFESVTNDKAFPHLTVVYEDSAEDKSILSRFGSEELGMLFKQIARLGEVRDLV